MRFVETHAWFLKDSAPKEDFPRELSDLPPDMVDKLPMTINLDTITSFNPSSNPYRTTVSFSNGERITVEISYDEMKKLVNEYGFALPHKCMPKSDTGADPAF